MKTPVGKCIVRSQLFLQYTLLYDDFRFLFRYSSVPDQISVNSSTKFLAVHTSQFSLLLDLWPPQSVIHPSAKVVVSDKNNEHEENIRFEPECFLSGKPQFGRGMVSLSYCNGLVSIEFVDIFYFTFGEFFHIQVMNPNSTPVKYRPYSNLKPLK